MPAIYIEGLSELTGKLQGLPWTLERKIGSQALRTGSKVIAAAVKQEAPRDESNHPRRQRGLLARNIKVRAAKRRQPGRVLIVVRPDQQQAWWGRLVDKGHRIGKRTAEQKRAAKLHENVADSRREVKANPFMERGFDRSQEQAAEAIKEKLAAGIEEALKA